MNRKRPAHMRVTYVIDYTDKKIDYNDILSDRDARYEMRDTKIANVGFRIAETNRRISGN